MTTTMTITTLVEPVTSRRLGHETRRNSIKTSWKNSRTFLSASIRVYVSSRLSGRAGGIRTPIPRIWSPVL